jgi:hypothetical protein
MVVATSGFGLHAPCGGLGLAGGAAVSVARQRLSQVVRRPAIALAVDVKNSRASARHCSLVKKGYWEIERLVELPRSKIPRAVSVHRNDVIEGS